MDRDRLLNYIEDALRSITHPRFFETERGYQGELLVALRRTIPDHVLPQGAVIEQEYQKALAHHGLTIRPDIIIHEPFDQTRHADRRTGNLAVIELKRDGTRAEAVADFGNLLAMLDLLDYPLGVFVNIGSGRTHANTIPEAAQARIVCFAATLTGEGVQVVRESARAF